MEKEQRKKRKQNTKPKLKPIKHLQLSQNS